MKGRMPAVLLGLVLCAATAGAQTASPIPLSVQQNPAIVPPAAAQQAAMVGPVLRSSAVDAQSLHGRQTAPLTPMASATSTMPRHQSLALMIVGGGAFVIGAIIGDTPGAVVMVGGVVVGLVGLYNYLE